MCLSVPGKILKKEGSKVIVDSFGSLSEAIAKGIEVEIGDYVMVQFGFVTEKVPCKEAEMLISDYHKLNSQSQ